MDLRCALSLTLFLASLAACGDDQQSQATDTVTPDTEVADVPADTAVPDSEDTAVPDSEDTALPDTADTAVPDSEDIADTAVPDSVDTVEPEVIVPTCAPGTVDLHGDASKCVTFSVVEVGGEHACAVTGEGELFCWGDNGYGQVGDGTTIGRPAPVQIGTEGGYTELALARTRACAIRDSAIYCWGQALTSNEAGSPTPRRVGSETGWHGIVAGDAHMCALRGGRVYCWGDNYWGQSKPTFDFQLAEPTAVSDETDWSLLGAGRSTTCGLRGTPGTAGLYCWGDNSFGQIQLPRTGQRTPVTAVGADRDWLTVSLAGSGACGLRGASGEATLYCWGDLSSLHLPTPGSPEVTQVGDDHDWIEVRAAARSACGRRADGVLSCWGVDLQGQLGQGTVAERRDLGLVPGRGWTDVSLGSNSTCGIRDGAVSCWGADSRGQLGLGEGGARPIPARVGSDTDWTVVSAGGDSTCGIAAGALYCWGNNDFGEIGDGTQLTRAVPQRVGSELGWTAVAVGKMVSYGLRAGQLYGWGTDVTGIGTRGSSYVPVAADGPATWTALATAGGATCGISAGAVYCWGRNVGGTLGTFAVGDSNERLQVGSDTDWVAVAVGYLHACGLKQGGALYCWGSNFSGALGDGTTTHRAAPGQVGTEVGWTTVAITGQTTFGVRAGRLYGWGRADERFLGATAESASSVPLLLGTGTDWTALAGAEAFVGIEASLCGLAGTRIDCWGANTFGQLGLGTTAAATEPSAVVGPFAAWRQVSVGDLHACGIATSGALACWGYNGSLALGRGGRWAPTPIVFAP